MKYHSEFKVQFSLLDPSEEPHIFALLQKIDAEVREKFPEIFDVANIDLFESADFEEESNNPRSATMYGILESDDPSKYATTKQLVHMLFSKFKRKHGLKYSIWASKILISSEKKTLKNPTISPAPIEELDLI